VLGGKWDLFCCSGVKTGRETSALTLIFRGPKWYSKTAGNHAEGCMVWLVPNHQKWKMPKVPMAWGLSPTFDGLLLTTEHSHMNAFHINESTFILKMLTTIQISKDPAIKSVLGAFSID